MTKVAIDKMKSDIDHVLQSHYSDDFKSGTAYIGSGLDFCAFKGSHAIWGSVVVKAPWKRIIQNENDPYQDTLDLLRQEGFLMEYLGKFDFPVPEFRELVQSDLIDYPLLICDYVPTDATTPKQGEVGALLDKLHCIPVPNYQLVAQEGLNWKSLLAKRIIRRLHAICAITNTSLGFLTQDDLEKSLQREGNLSNSCILHMDIRPENFRMKAGKIQALIDWGNALIGHPILEWMRVHEYGDLGKPFDNGYPISVEMAECPEVLNHICCLDTAAMLTLVFLSESPDQVLAKKWIKRTEFLIKIIEMHHR